MEKSAWRKLFISSVFCQKHRIILVLTDFVVPKYDSGFQDETDFPGPEHAGEPGRISVSSSDPVSYFPIPQKKR